MGTGEAFSGTDAGEHVSPMGPFPGVETASLSDASVTVALSDTDTGSGAEGNVVGTGVHIGDFDSSRPPATQPQDADGGSVTEASSISAALSDTESRSFVDGPKKPV